MQPLMNVWRTCAQPHMNALLLVSAHLRANAAAHECVAHKCSRATHCNGSDAREGHMKVRASHESESIKGTHRTRTKVRWRRAHTDAHGGHPHKWDDEGHIHPTTVRSWRAHSGWRRIIGCLMSIGHFLQKNPILSGSFAENDVRLQASYESAAPSKSEIPMKGT